MQYNRFRYYDPSIGRYVSADPIGQFGILSIDGVGLSQSAPDEIRVDSPFSYENAYRYALNSPSNHADPTGEGPYATGACIALGALAAAIDIAGSQEFEDQLADLDEELKKNEEDCDISEEERTERRLDLKLKKIQTALDFQAAASKNNLLGFGVGAVCATIVNLAPTP